MFRRFLTYYKPYAMAVKLLVLGSLLRALLELLFPYLVKQILDEQLPKANIQLVLEWSAILFALYIGNFVLQYAISYGGLSVSSLLENDLRMAVFSKLQALSFGFYDKHKSGELLSRLTNDINEIGELASRTPIDLVVSVLSMTGTIAMMLYLQPALGALITVLLMLKTVHTLYINRKMQSSFGAVRAAMGVLSAKAAESLGGIRLVQAFVRENLDRQRFAATADSYLSARRSTFRLRSYFMGSITFFSNFINVAILLGGGLLIHRGLLTFGELVAFLLYMGLFLKPLMQLMMFTEVYQRGMSGFARCIQLLDEPVGITDAVDALPCEKVRGSITFENICFSYSQGQQVLHNFCLQVEPGQNVAIVGATGAGKSTIANLLLRFYEPQSGRILIDGVDIHRLQLKSLRQQIGLVQQDVFLFGSTVAENIAYGKVDATLEEIRQAARFAEADAFISALPKGYETEIGERGIRLSGGQKQRLALARIFLKNPPILVLDEATSALDNKTERLLQHELDRLSVGRTSIIIAHRLSTIQKADKIIVLRDGAIAEAGSHEELLAKGGLYAELYTKE